MNSRFFKAFRQIRRCREVIHCVRDCPDWAQVAGTYLGLRQARFPMQFRTRRFGSLRLETFHDLVTAWVIFFRPEYEVRETDKVIVDVGANIGAFSLYAAHAAPQARIWSLEPFPRTHSRLLETIESNALGERVRCLPMALEDRDGTACMVDTGAPSQSLGTTNQETAEGGFTVQAVTLATLFEREGLGDVDLLKIDIEGAEHRALAVVPDSVWARIRRLALEYHSDGSKSQLFSRLQRVGFRLEYDHEADSTTGVASFVRVELSSRMECPIACHASMNATREETVARTDSLGTAVRAPELEIASLTSIRGIAAFWVVVSHLWVVVIALLPTLSVLSPLSHAGSFAVPLFFVLSGYVLGLRYLTQFRSTTPATVFRFWLLRLGRIYPVHFCTLLITFVIFTRREWPDADGWRMFLANCLLVHAWGYEFRGSWNYPAWSISSEWFAYLIFPVAVWLVARTPQASRWVLTVVACGASAAVYAFVEQIPFKGLAVVVPTFLGGVAMASVFPPESSRMSYWGGLGMLAGAALPFVVEPGPLQSVLYILLSFLLVGFLGASGAHGAAIWRNPLLLYLGEISYSLYMMHAICINLIVRFLPISILYERSVFERTAVLLTCIAAILAASMVMYHAIECPLRNWTKRRWALPRPEPPAAP